MPTYTFKMKSKESFINEAPGLLLLLVHTYFSASVIVDMFELFSQDSLF